VFTVTLWTRARAHTISTSTACSITGHGTSTSQEDVLSFNFSFTARDDDGDTATNGFTVGVIDDSPVADNTTATVNEHDLTQAAFDQNFDAATDVASAGFFDGGQYGRCRSMPRATA